MADQVQEDNGPALRLLDAGDRYMRETSGKQGDRLVMVICVYDQADGLRREDRADARLRAGRGPRPRRKPHRVVIREVLSVAEKPLKGEAVARRGGVRCTAHFRCELAAMRRAGELTYPGGYWLAERPLPGGLFQAAPAEPSGRELPGAGKAG